MGHQYKSLDKKGNITKLSVQLQEQPISREWNSDFFKNTSNLEHREEKK